MSKITVMIQYFGHVINAQGSITHRLVEIELTEEQSKKLKLKKDEDFGVVAIEVNND